MKAYIMTNEHEMSVDQKLKRLESYSVTDLLYVVKEFENNHYSFSKQVIKRVYGLLAEKNIFLRDFMKTLNVSIFTGEIPVV